jgi:lactoylglutathione lyase
VKGGVEGFLHVVITVSDMDASLAFYRDLLGLRVAYAWDHDPDVLSKLTGYPRPKARAVILECPDGTELELVEFREPRSATTSPKRWHDAGPSFLAFRVTNISDLVEGLERAAVRFNSEVVDYRLEDAGVVRVVYCFAPEGTTITLAEFPPGRRRLSDS